MDNKKFLHQRRDIKTIIESVANKIKVLPRLVEKDYWISLVLKRLSESIRIPREIAQYSGSTAGQLL